MATKIEWVQNADGTKGETWNPIVGCTSVSPGCDHCYAARMSRRLEAMGKKDYVGLTTPKHFNGVVRTLEHKLSIPLKKKKPTMWFVNSMSDLFHKDVPFEFIDKVFAVMAICPQHTFLVLTKRAERMVEYFSAHDVGLRWALAVHELQQTKKGWPDPETAIDWDHNGLPNVWLGVSVEDQKRADERIPHLLRCPAAVRFISAEPLLGPLDIARWMWPLCWHWDGGYDSPEAAIAAGAYAERKRQALLSRDAPLLNWCIVGGESGPGARPMHPGWPRSLRDQCVAAGVAFFFKQGSQANWQRFKDFDSFPEDLKIREHPNALHRS